VFAVNASVVGFTDATVAGTRFVYPMSSTLTVMPTWIALTRTGHICVKYHVTYRRLPFTVSFGVDYVQR